MPASNRYPYRYFVSYNWGGGVGALDAYLSQPITSWADIESLTKMATDQCSGRGLFTTGVVILNYQLMSGPGSNVDEARLAAAELALRDLLSLVDQFNSPNNPERVHAFVGDVRRVALRGLGDGRG